MISSPSFLSAHNTAQSTGIPEKQIRRMIKEGRCPGYYVGRKFMVNVDRLIQQLDEASQANGQEADNGKGKST